jgi:hypothetical protein
MGGHDGYRRTWYECNTKRVPSPERHLGDSDRLSRIQDKSASCPKATRWRVMWDRAGVRVVSQRGLDVVSLGQRSLGWDSPDVILML